MLLILTINLSRFKCTLPSAVDYIYLLKLARIHFMISFLLESFTNTKMSFAADTANVFTNYETFQKETSKSHPFAMEICQ